ncbi:MAG TPA: glycosyltransferase [Flavisolibacter sp.]|nr:glycosyltransferase [Flavisolibacter sp.]
MEKEFPNLKFLPLEGYQIRYASRKVLFTWRLISQLPRLLRTIKKEKIWMQQLLRNHSIDGVISDNRYGLYHATLPTVFITHQLRIHSGFGSVADSLVQKLHYRFIGRFSQCWVPDFAGTPNLAGSLSHPRKKPAIPVHYLGTLSRMQAEQDPSTSHLVFLLSGPEPQRTLLENHVIKQLKNFTSKAIVLRGLPEEGSTPYISDSVTVYNHLPAEALQTILQNASLVICRSGYSSIMDLAALKKKSFLIPTPGQTEQEYLAVHLERIGFAPFMTQHRFDLDTALKKAAVFAYRLPDIPAESPAAEAVSHFVQQLGSGKA